MKGGPYEERWASTVKADDVIKPAWRTSYDKEVRILWQEAVTISSQLYLIERIGAFPFDVLVVDTGPFWILVQQGLYESCVVAMWRITLDKRRETLTLDKFADAVVENAVSPEVRAKVEAAMTEVGFEMKLKSIGPQIERLRHEALAHLNRETARAIAEGSQPMPVVPVGDLVSLRDKINELVQVLSFDMGRGFLPLEYSANVRYPSHTDPRPDIERLLDSLARDSGVLNMPEQQPEHWKVYREQISPSGLSRINQYRRKFGLPEV